MAMYNTYLTDCLDKHAPWRNVRVRDSTPHPWYDSAIDDAREKKRKLENVWRRTKLEIHRQLYVTAREDCTALISARKADYYKNRLAKADNKTMFRLLRSLDGQRIQQHPEFHSTAQGCKLFSLFFSEKIDKLLTGLKCFNTRYEKASVSSRQCMLILPPSHQSNQPFFFNPNPQRNAQSMPSSHRGLTTAMHSYTARL